MGLLPDTSHVLPVILTDDTDFKTPETGVVYNAAGMSVKYRNPEAPTTWSTFTPSAANWDELGNGVYQITFTADQIGDTEGQFIYYVIATGILSYYGMVLLEDALSIPTATTIAAAVLDKLLADHTTTGSVGLAISNINTIVKTIFVPLVGHGLHVLRKDPEVFMLALNECYERIEELPEEQQVFAKRLMPFWERFLDW